MAANFVYSTREHKFILKEWLDMSKVFGQGRFEGGYSLDEVDSILENAMKIAKEVVAPTNEDGDKQHAVYKNGKVTTPESFKKPYWTVQENGLGSSNADHSDPSALPLCLMGCTNEYLAAANAASGPYVMATTGASGLIRDFGNEKVKNIFLPKMFSGQWAGTMDLTEPNSGSDVGDIITKATPTDEPGVYKIVGTKCFITGGDQDITENIVHLTLARIEGCVPGTKGISLFVVPKYWHTPEGEKGEFNDVNCGGVEHKMGLCGSATSIINFGEEGKCRGYLLGDPPADGKGAGMAQMFQMMNEERTVTGLAALAAATVSYNNAALYAAGRIQGRQLTNPKAGRVPIINHEDVRRMLMYQKSITEASRAMIAMSYYCMDVMENTKDENERKRAKAFVEVNIPIVKAWCSDLAFLSISEAMQCYGGYGFSEEYPIAQQLRDCRIYPIWEGTNFIQSMDLIGRKWMMAGGQVFGAWFAELEKFAADHKDDAVLKAEVALLEEALAQYKEIQGTMAGYLGQGKFGMIGFYATRILHATGYIYGAKLLLEHALIAQKKIDEIGKEHFEYPYYAGKVASAKFFAHNLLPNVGLFLRVIKEGDNSVMEIPEASYMLV
ncbi:MAG: Acyl-CoA dehydrogenase [Deltaproteobacteria bacterium ADurb.Bin151]|nr:MAG: Acyl-CoA dehydrogenase [Deltaproteobacteria bacterium ADurb.Bin151]HNZ10882.1 acyl-CoA dehydrogenase [Smithellaceae bacterium]HOG81743.1 acyl-CoA dehydrogenase [Smithellaceae bacterium]HOQ41960.1 acyl-CoA dehydrogenase [Smithellaceae bacterium]HQP24463.1 acyl-CoA dehydrogenase [Smithellaceae bacterium]